MKPLEKFIFIPKNAIEVILADGDDLQNTSPTHRGTTINRESL
jgi:hypothetical protein